MYEGSQLVQWEKLLVRVGEAVGRLRVRVDMDDDG